MSERRCHNCGRYTHKECYACGQPICDAESVVMPHYYELKKKRICSSCLRDHFDNGEQIRVWLEYTSAGYNVGKMPVPVQGGKIAGTDKPALVQPNVDYYKLVTEQGFRKAMKLQRVPHRRLPSGRLVPKVMSLQDAILRAEAHRAKPETDTESMDAQALQVLAQEVRKFQTEEQCRRYRGR